MGLVRVESLSLSGDTEILTGKPSGYDVRRWKDGTAISLGLDQINYALGMENLLVCASD
jgi:hypothetical protein